MNGLLLDIKGRSTDEGARVHMYEDSHDDDDNQYWWEDENGIIRSKLHGFALTAEGTCGCSLWLKLHVQGTCSSRNMHVHVRTYMHILIRTHRF